MRKQMLVLLALVVSVVFLSGCPVARTGGGGAAAGVVIRKFKPDVVDIYGGDDISFELYIENLGEAEATGPDGKDDLIIDFFGLGTDWDPNSATEKVEGGLDKAQPEHDIPGGEWETVFTSTSPEKAKGTFKVTARVTYGYETSAVGALMVYHEDYLDSLPPEEEERIRKTSALESFDVTNAPVTLSLAGVTRAYVYREGQDNIAAVTIEIANIGHPGRPYLEDMSKPQVEIESVTVDDPPRECENTFKAKPRIPSDGDTRFVCKFELPSDIGEYSSMPIEIELSYNYMTQLDTTIKVIPEIE